MAAACARLSLQSASCPAWLDLPATLEECCRELGAAVASLQLELPQASCCEGLPAVSCAGVELLLLMLGATRSLLRLPTTELVCLGWVLTFPFRLLSVFDACTE